MDYEKDKQGFTLDQNLSTHIIASVEKALVRQGVISQLAALNNSIAGLQETLNSIDASLKSLDSKTK